MFLGSMPPNIPVIKENFNYSMKNIPLPSNNEVRKQLIHSLGKFTRNLRWKVDKHKNPEKYRNSKQTYGIPSCKAAPIVPELHNMEQKLKNMVQNVQFRFYNDSLQQKLKADKVKISQESKVYVKGDKSKNFYKATPEHYDHLLKKAVHKSYHVAEPDDINKRKKLTK